MVKIIETNLSICNATGEIMDHQSRIVEAESWMKYVDYYFRHMSRLETEEFKCISGSPGRTLLSRMEIMHFESDAWHLTCDTEMNVNLNDNPHKWITKKLAYLIED